MSDRSFFIVSCARSGSTSLAQILNRATNGRCETEPVPDLNRECRDLMDGRLSEDPIAVLERTVVPRVTAALGQMAVYGEKHVTYGPFLRSMYRRLGCKFIYLKRDGRDVVRSLMDWHNLKFGTIYREAHDTGGESEKALTSAANLPTHIDTSDYARPRPRPSDPLYAEWETLTRFEMCTYYWVRINKLYLDELGGLPADSWVTLDYRRPTASDILRAATFVGLEGLEPDVVAGMLEQRINSVGSRAGLDAADPIRSGPVSAPAGFPNWKGWTAELTVKFDRLAAPMMRQLGYSAD